MKEESVRPSELMQKNAILEAQDAQDLLTCQPFVEVACPSCGAQGEHIFSKLGYHFLECGCKMIFVNPRPTGKQLYDYYASARHVAHWANEIMPIVENERRRSIFLPRVNKVLDLINVYDLRHDCIWDIGAGTGIFCEELIKTRVFREVRAVEMSPDSVRKCRMKDVPVIESPLEGVKYSNCVNILTAFEVIEHVFDPQIFLKTCHHLLDESGVLIMSTPNVQGFDMSILMEDSPNICAPAHLNYFCPDSIKRLLRACNFTVIDLCTPGQLDVDIVRNATPEHLDRFVKVLLFDRWSKEWGEILQEFLSNNLLSSHMLVVARKS